MNRARYVEAQEAWLLPALEGETCEVLVAGSRTAPNEMHLALTENAIRSLSKLRAQAIAYLDGFIDRNRFAADSKWDLEGFDCGVTAESANQFTLSFSLNQDIYGKWSVTFRVAKGTYSPVGLARVQV